MGILEGKQGIIYGVRNDRSLCWGCAQSLAREGARLALTFLGSAKRRTSESSPRRCRGATGRSSRDAT